LVVPEIENFQMIFKKMMTSDPDLVYISPRLRFRMIVRDYDIDKLNLPPDSPEATFMMDLLCIAFPKGSALTVKFSRM
jgi:hypothetical protein